MLVLGHGLERPLCDMSGHKDAMVSVSHKGTGWVYRSIKGSGDVLVILGRSSGHRRPVCRKVEDVPGNLSGRPEKILS